MVDCEFTAGVMQNHYPRVEFADGSFQCTAPGCLWVGAWTGIQM